MKTIAIPSTETNQIDDHFGHCEFYKIYTIDDNGKIVHEEILNSEQGCGCKSNIATILANKGVTIMLAGGIGQGAINILNNAGIQVIRGCSGDIQTLLDLFINGKLFDSGISCSLHHKHHN